MLAENKVQLEAIKTRNYMFGEKDGYILCTEGKYIVYIKKEDFLLDIEKQKKIPEKGVEQFSPFIVKGEIREAELSKRMACSGTMIYRAIKDKETGEYAWFNVKYINLFKECNVGLRKNESNKTYDAVFMRYGEIVGYVMPIARVGDWD